MAAGRRKLWRASPPGSRAAEARRKAGTPDQHGGRDGGAAPDLERETGDGTPGSAADRGGDALGGGAGPPGGQPGRGRHRRGAAEERLSGRSTTGRSPMPKWARPSSRCADPGAYPATVLAFEFLVLTACRSGEVRGALWEEMDLEAREWRIPAERMKTHREHRVPLSGRALAVLREAQRLAAGSGLVFPSARGRPAVRGGDLEDGPGSPDRCGAARVPVELPGLGGGVHGRAA